MAKANTAKFSQYVLEVEFDPGRNPNTFTKVCGLVSRGMNRQHNMAVTAVPDCADENLPSQNQRSVDSSDVSISGTGVYARQSHQKMLDWWYGGHTLNVRVKHVKAIRGETEYEGSVSEVYAWAADCCGEAGPRRCPPDHADEMEPSQIAVQVLRGDAAIAAQETLQLAVAAIDRLNVEGIPDPLSGRKVQGFVANAHGRSAGRIAAMTVRNQNDVGIQNRFEHRLQGLGVDRRKNLADGCAAAIGGDQDRHLFIRQAALAGLAATLARLAIQSARSLVALKHVSLVNFDNALEFRPILACGLQETVPPAEGRIDAKSASTGRFPYRLALGQRHAE